MKKQLLAMAVAAAFMASASAAQVEVYGGLDGGLMFSHGKQKFNKPAGLFDVAAEQSSEVKDNRLTMENGMSAPSRWGLKGLEDLGNGYSVSFKLEGAIAMDTGASGEFKRESRLTFGTPYGEFSFGRMGSLSSSCGSYDLFAANATVYDGGWGVAIGYNDLFYGDFQRMDNTVTYVTPTANGFTGYLQYSNKYDDSHSGSEGKSSTGRYFGAGVSYANGPLTVVATAEMNKNANKNNDILNDKDTQCFSLGGNYVFPNGTVVYLAAQYGVNTASWAYSDFNEQVELETYPTMYVYPNPDGSNTGFGGANGYNLVVGTAVPCFGGTIKSSLNFTQLKEKDPAFDDMKKSEFRQIGVALTYEYDFSKRTTAYAGAGYNEMRYKNNGTTFLKTTVAQAVVGLRHSF